MKKLITIAALTTLWACGAQAQELRIATSADFPPWEYTDSSGNIIGFDRSVGDEICQRIEAKCVWINQTYDGLLPGLQVGKFDLVMSGVSITEERAKQVDFTRAYADAPNHVGTSAGNPIAQAKTRQELEAALEGKIIGTQIGTTHEVVVRAHFKQVDVRLYERNEQMADDLASGRIDAALVEYSVWEELMKIREGQIELAGPMLTSADYAEFGEGQGIAMKKGQDELKARMDKAISDMLADGTMTKISNEFFGYDLSFKE